MWFETNSTELPAHHSYTVLEWCHESMVICWPIWSDQNNGFWSCCPKNGRNPVFEALSYVVLTVYVAFGRHEWFTPMATSAGGLPHQGLRSAHRQLVPFETVIHNKFVLHLWNTSVPATAQNPLWYRSYCQWRSTGFSLAAFGSTLQPRYGKCWVFGQNFTKHQVFLDNQFLDKFLEFCLKRAFCALSFFCALFLVFVQLAWLVVHSYSFVVVLEVSWDGRMMYIHHFSRNSGKSFHERFAKVHW